MHPQTLFILDEADRREKLYRRQALFQKCAFGASLLLAVAAGAYIWIVAVF